MPSSSPCRVDVMLRLIGDRWTLGIIHELSIGPRRTLELLGSFTGLSTKTLADRLKKLERGSIIRRISYPESPPRVEYSLTAKGRALTSILDAISDVAAEWAGGSETPSRSCTACASRTSKERVNQGADRQADIGKGSRRRTDVTLL